MELALNRTARSYLTLLTLAALLCGCMPEGGNINDNPNAGTIQDQYNTLVQRPDIEEATEKYKSLLDEVKAALTTRFDLPEWEYTDGSRMDESGCGFNFPDVRADQGVARSIRGGFTRESIPSRRWDEALQLVTKIANEYGFKGPQRIADEPGNREAYYFDAAGTRFAFGQVDNISIGISTGCFLTSEAHRRGGPVPAADGS